jgi:peroxin-1
MLLLTDTSQILLAVARKVSVSASVDFDGLARVTDGYSGADLQALVYNAHLQVVHASISSVDRKKPQLMGEEAPSVVYTVVGGKGGQGVISKAEMVALERRVGPVSLL